MKRTLNQRRRDRKYLGAAKARSRQFEATFGWARDFPAPRLLTANRIRQYSAAYQRAVRSLVEATP